jgi:hypothetical protein
MKARLNWLARIGVISLVFLASFASPAYAKKGDDEKLPPYDVTGLEHERVWVPWVFAFVFMAGCLAIAFKNPHRSTTERT